MSDVDKEGKKLIKNTMIVTIGKISTQIITFLLLPLYTHFLTTEDYGIVDLLATLVSFLLPIVTLQLEQGVFRFLIDCRADKERTKKLISTSMIFMIFQSITMILIFLAVSIFIDNKYKWFLLFNVIINIFSSVLLQISRGLGDNLKYSIGSMIISSTTILSNILFIAVLNYGAVGMLLGTFIGHLIGIVYILLSKKIYRYIEFKAYDKSLLKELLKYSFPLVPTMISWWIVNVSDRLLVTYFIGSGMNGIYSVANKFSSILTMLYGIFNLTWTESAAINIESTDMNDFFNKVYEKVVKIMGCFCIGIIAFMPLVIKLLVDEKFMYAYFQIPILIVAAYFCNLSSFEGGIYIAKKKSKEVAKSTIGAAIINILINYMLINKIGLYAASISSLIAYFTIYIYRLFDLKKYINLKLNKKVSLIIYMYMFISIIIYYYHNVLLCVVNATIASIFSICINIRDIRSIFCMLKSKMLKN